MSFLQDFEEDVFISYSHIDDDQYGDEPKGWVSQLHEDIQKCVSVHLGVRAALWRDAQIRDYEDFEKKILRRLTKTAAFLFVNSPSFFKRDWCIRELTAFCQYAARDIGIRVAEDKLRIFKVEKNRVDLETLPSELRLSGSYRFYAPDPANPSREYPLRPKLGPSEFRSYYMKVDDLSKDLADVLQAMASRGPSASPASSSPVVYLAETTSDLREEASEIRRDLKCRGVTVLPPFDLPDEAREMKQTVKQYLDRAILSIHLIGREFGTIPEGESKKSKQWLQHDLAMERETQGQFKRYIWIPPYLSPHDPRQDEWIKHIHTNTQVQQNGAEILTSKLEDLKSIIMERLERRTKPETTSIKSNSCSSVQRPNQVRSGLRGRIYVISDLADDSCPELHDIRKELFTHGYEPLFVVPASDEESALKEHLDCLTLCDAVLIFYGNGTQKWITSKLMDLRKYLPLRKTPLLGKAVYIAAPSTPEKANFMTLELDVFRPLDPDPSSSVFSFLNSFDR